MKIIRRTFHLLVVFFLITLSNNTDLAGVKISLNPTSLRLAIDTALPYISSSFKHIQVPDQNLDIDLGICDLSINLSNINIYLNGIVPEHVSTTPTVPNKVVINLAMINGNGGFHVHLKCGILPSADDDVVLTVNRVDSQLVFQVDEVPSPHAADKMMPNVHIVDIEFPVFDFDFDMSGVVGEIAKVAKPAIKSYIQKVAINMLKNNIQGICQSTITDPIKNLPVYVELGGILPIFNGFAVDISVTSGFKATDSIFDYNSNGDLSNDKQPGTRTSPYPLADYLPDTDTKGKNVQIFLSEYFVNTLLLTLYKSGLLRYTITEDIMPSSIISLDTTTLDPIFTGLVNKYGQSKKVQIAINEITAPLISLNQTITLNLQVQSSIQVDIGVSYESCVVFTSDVVIEARASLAEGGKASGQVLSFKLSNSKVDSTLLPNVNIGTVEEFVNNIALIAMPIINDKLKLIQINIPVIQDFNISEMVANVNSKYVEVGINPKKEHMYQGEIGKNQDQVLSWLQ
jgi:hypothetical protein